MWFFKLIRQFFFAIDKIVYSFIPAIYDLITSIARTSVLSQADIADMADRIYKLLAVFMIFKVTFSLIMYVVNPDDFSDKSKGVAKLVTNIIISLAILILTPYIFNYAYRLQTIILEDNLMASLIFSTESNDDSYFTTAGDKMAYITISPFLTPNTSIDKLSPCNTLLSKETLSDGTIGTKFNEDCANAIRDLPDKSYDDTDVGNYITGVETSNFGYLFRDDIITATAKDNGSEVFVMDYKIIFSTAVGVVIVLILVGYCLDVATRSIKLAFLQLIAPIPILSYVDPKSGKDGLFKKWYQTCFKTYLSLFIRLLALYFAVYIIGRVADMKMVDIVDGSYVSNAFVAILIIVGALMFAKQLPKILEGLGIKLDSGSFNLNPLKKIEKEALGGKALTKPIKAGFGLNTAAKKFIGGIDAARNGKGFKQGWNRTHGKLYNNFYKKLDEWAPDSAEARKNERIGRENLHKFEEKEENGRDLYRRAKGEDSNLEFSPEYRKSFNTVKDAKNEMYAAQAKKQADIATISQNLEKDNENARQACLRKDGTLDEKKYTEMCENNNKKAQDKIKNVEKEAGTAEKRYDVAKAKHEEMKKIYRKDAAMEDAFDYFDKTASAKEKAKILGKDSPSSSDSSSTANSPSFKSVVENSPDIVFDSGNNSNVQEIVNDATGVNRTPANESGAPTADNSALKDYTEANFNQEELEKKQREINRLVNEINLLIQKRSKVTTGDEYMKLTEEINRKKIELERLKNS